MKIHPLLLLIPLVVSVAGSVQAQQPTPSPTPTITDQIGPFWKCRLPAGDYLVLLRNIISVSKQQYNVDGAAVVTEVNIGTSSPFLARFYFIEPLAPSGSETADFVKEKIKEAAEAATEGTGQDDVWRKVVKNYPTTTHSGTIEYRLASADELNKLYNSVEGAWRTNRDTTFKIVRKKEEQ